MRPALTSALAFGSALLIGSAATVVPRLFETAPCDPSCGGPSTVHPPLTSTLVVFLASSLGLAFAHVPLLGGRAGGVFAGRDTAASSSPSPSSLWLSLLRTLLVPSLLNVAGTLSQLAALLLIPAAVLAGMRGLLILFTALLSARLSLADAPKGPAEWGLTLLAAAGAAAVGGAAVGGAAAAAATDGAATTTAATAASSPSTSSTLVGLGLCALGYTLASAQVAVEAVLLSDKGIPKWGILGVEGAVGAALLAAAMGLVQAAVPPDANALEVPAHTACCLSSDPPLVAFAVAYGLLSVAFNSLLLSISTALGPNARVFVFTARGVVTWAVEAALYAAGSGFGEPLRGAGWTALELLGFVALIGGGVARARLAAARAAAATAKKNEGEGEGAGELLLAGREGGEEE
jgi:hypothetical protein